MIDGTQGTTMAKKPTYRYRLPTADVTRYWKKWGPLYVKNMNRGAFPLNEPFYVTDVHHNFVEMKNQSELEKLKIIRALTVMSVYHGFLKEEGRKLLYDDQCKARLEARIRQNKT
jgi:hypothetical protein